MWYRVYKGVSCACVRTSWCVRCTAQLRIDLTKRALSSRPDSPSLLSNYGMFDTVISDSLTTIFWRCKSAFRYVVVRVNWDSSEVHDGIYWRINHAWVFYTDPIITQNNNQRLLDIFFLSLNRDFYCYWKNFCFRFRDKRSYLLFHRIKFRLKIL